MRQLATKDIFTMSRIITKANLKDELRRIVKESEAGETKLNMGIDLMLGVLAGASSKAVETDIYAFLADVLESTPDDIANSDPDLLITRLTTDDGSKQWKDFFSKLAKWMRP